MPVRCRSSRTPIHFFGQMDAIVTLDRERIKRFEDAREGNDAQIQIMLSGLLWYPARLGFEVARASGHLQVSVPKSHWIDRVISAWGLSKNKVIEINFPSNAVGENFRKSYARVEEAEKFFASGDYKQVLTTLRLSFEGLAKSLGFERAGEDFFASLFASALPEKQDKARDALTAIYKFLHLGPHEQANHPNPNAQPVVKREDARFALTLAYVIFEYITPEA